MSVSNGDVMTFVERLISLAFLVLILLVVILPLALRVLRGRHAGRHRAAVRSEVGE